MKHLKVFVLYKLRAQTVSILKLFLKVEDYEVSSEVYEAAHALEG